MAYLIEARFTGADGTNASAYPPEAGTFLSQVGPWLIQGNKLVNTGGGTSYAFWDAGIADVLAKGKITLAASGNFYMGIAFNFDGSHYWNITAYSGDGKFWLNYDDTQISGITAAHGFANGETHELGVYASPDGDTIHLLSDGVEVIGGGFPFTESSRRSKSGTGFGFWTYQPADNGSACDDLLVASLAAISRPKINSGLISQGVLSGGLVA